MASQSLHHLINERQSKVVFPCGRIQLSVVDAHPPSRLNTSWDQLILFVLDYCNSSLIGHHMNWTHPFAVRDWVYDTCIQKLDYLSSNYLLHGWVQPSLWLMREFSIFFQVNLVHHHCRADAFFVSNWPPYGFFMFFQHIQQFLFLSLIQVSSNDHR